MPKIFWQQVLRPFLGWGLCLGMVLVPGLARADEARSVTLSGQVRTLVDVLKDRGITADASLVGDAVVLESSDGQVSALLPNGASKALFLDERLRERPTELTAWKHPGLTFLEVVSFRVEENGKLRTPEYFCEICTISVRYPQVCPCCQGPMELRYQPAAGE